MKASRWAREYQLHDGLRFADRLDVDHHVAYTAERRIFFQRAGNDRRRHLYTDEGRQMACPLAFSPDAKTLYHAHEQLVAIDVKSGKSRALTRFKGKDRFGIFWNLCVAPGSGTIYFRHARQDERSRGRICAIDADGQHLRTIYEPETGGLWSFWGDFERSRLKAMVYVTLDGKAQRLPVWLTLTGVEIAPEKDAPIDAERTALLYMPDGTLTSAPRPGPSRTYSSSILEDGSLAFVHEDQELFRRVNGTDATPLITRKRRASHSWLLGHSVAPLSSPDRRVLWFSLTSGTRIDTLSARIEKAIRNQYEGHPQLERFVERAHWQYKHRVGFIDWRTRRVWLGDGAWRNVAWAPSTVEKRSQKS